MGVPNRANPLDDLYRAPGSDLFPPSPRFDGIPFEQSESAEAQRTRFLPYESNVRAAGMVNIVQAGLGVVGIALTLTSAKVAEEVAKLSSQVSVPESTFRNIMIVAYLFGITLNLSIGCGLLDLRNWARRVVIFFGVLGLIGKLRFLLNPAAALQSLTPSLATLTSVLSSGLSVIVLILLFQSQARSVCTVEYRYLMAETPEIRPRFSSGDWMLVGGALAIGILGEFAVFL